MKILLFCAKGFEMMEFSPFIDVMGWAKNDYHFPVSVETCGYSKTVVSAFGVPVLMDKVLEEIDPAEYDALAVPGGFEEFGFYEEAYDERFSALIRAFHAQQKLIASVCVAALPLGKSGILKGKRATTYHLNGARRQKQLAEFGAVHGYGLKSVQAIARKYQSELLLEFPDGLFSASTALQIPEK